jgi:hypothetical protein
MINVCKHVAAAGLHADRVFVHRGQVLAVFCTQCEPDFKAADEHQLELPQFWMKISDERAERLGLPLRIDSDEEASVFGRS